MAVTSAWRAAVAAVAKRIAARQPDPVPDPGGRDWPVDAARHARCPVRWSVAQARAVLGDRCGTFASVIGEPGRPVLVDGSKMPGAQFFPEAKLNYRRKPAAPPGRPRRPGVPGRGQGRGAACPGASSTTGSRAWRSIAAAGLKPGDRVAGFVPNMPETIVAMLATAAIGAVWSSCSPDFGVAGVLDRFGQIEPRMLITADGYRYNGKSHNSLARVARVPAGAADGGAAWSCCPISASHPTSRRLPQAQVDWLISVAPFAAARSPSNACPSIIRSTSCIPSARPACRNASCMATAARCCSI